MAATVSFNLDRIEKQANRAVGVKEQADLQQIERDLAGFVELFKQHPTLEKVMLNPAVPVPRKSAAVAELTSRVGTSPMVTKLLLLLAEGILVQR